MSLFIQQLLKKKAFGFCSIKANFSFSYFELENIVLDYNAEKLSFGFMQAHELKVSCSLSVDCSFSSSVIRVYTLP